MMLSRDLFYAFGGNGNVTTNLPEKYTTMPFSRVYNMTNC